MAREQERRGGTHGRRPGGHRGGGKPRSDARRAALGALYDVLYKGAYAQLALGRALESVRLSPDDRRLATNLFYTAVEQRLQLEYYLSRFISETPDNVVMALLLLSAAQLLYMDKIPDFAVVNEAAKLTRSFGFEGQTGFVNGVLRAFARARDAGELTPPDEAEQPVAHLSIAYSVPEALIERLIAAHGLEFARAMLAYAPDVHSETIRPNFMRYTPESFEESLKRRGWDYEKTPVTGAFSVRGQGNLALDPAFAAGEFSVQSAPSLLAAQAVMVKPGMNVLDACAAPGGKAAAMAEYMGGTGRVYAWDVHAHRVDILNAVARRLRLDNLRGALRDATALREGLLNEMDAVLLDAPCSGLGMLGNKPDAKFRYEDARVDELVELQKRLLDTVCQYVRPGGALVYSTCTVLPEENEAQVRAFLASHPEFHLAPFPVPEAYASGLKDHMLALYPHLNGCEGFFIARMERDE